METTKNNIVLQNDIFYPSLSDFIGPSSLRVGDMSSYSLRNSDKYKTIDTKSHLYYNSFLPSAVREWNAFDR